jgi:hypothetical protein
MWADNETRIDLLGFDFLVDELLVILRDPRLLPVTVGVAGDWGSGKTSLIAMAEDALAEDNKFLTGHSTGRRSSSSPDPRTSTAQMRRGRLITVEAADRRRQDDAGAPARRAARLDADPRTFPLARRRCT